MIDIRISAIIIAVIRRDVRAIGQSHIQTYRCRSFVASAVGNRIAENSQGETLEKGEALESMQACIKRNMKGLTAKVSGPQNAGPLDRRVRLCLHLLIWLRLGCAANQ